MMEDNERTSFLVYTTEEHKHYDRSVDFYWALGLIALAVAVLAFILKDGLFGILILIAAGLYGYSSWKKPGEVIIEITNKDIVIGDDLYLISNIDSFRILDIKGDKELVLVIRRIYHPIVSVAIPNGLENQVKEILSSMLPVNDTAVPHIGRRFMARFKI